MASILESELAATISAALIDASIPYDIIVTRTTPGDGPAYDPGPPTLTDYDCKGFTEAFTADYIAGGLVQANDVKVVILLPSVAIMPAPGDSVTVRGNTYAVIAAMPDPALATIELQARA